MMAKKIELHNQKNYDSGKGVLFLDLLDNTLDRFEHVYIIFKEDTDDEFNTIMFSFIGGDYQTKKLPIQYYNQISETLQILSAISISQSKTIARQNIGKDELIYKIDSDSITVYECDEEGKRMTGEGLLANIKIGSNKSVLERWIKSYSISNSLENLTISENIIKSKNEFSEVPIENAQMKLLY